LLLGENLSHFGQDILGRTAFAGPHLLNRHSKGLHLFRLLGQLDELLIGSGVPYDQFSLAVDGQDDRLAGFLQVAQELQGVPLEARARVDVPVDIQHAVYSSHAI